MASRPPERAASGQDATDLEPPAMQEPKPRPTPPGPRLVTWFPYSLEGAWLTWKVEINGPWAILLLVTIVSRFWRIDFPTGVVYVSCQLPIVAAVLHELIAISSLVWGREGLLAKVCLMQLVYLLARHANVHWRSITQFISSLVPRDTPIFESL